MLDDRDRVQVEPNIGPTFILERLGIRGYLVYTDILLSCFDAVALRKIGSYRFRLGSEWGCEREGVGGKKALAP
jgi:hypothetical protein